MNIIWIIIIISLSIVAVFLLIKLFKGNDSKSNFIMTKTPRAAPGSLKHTLVRYFNRLFNGTFNDKSLSDLQTLYLNLDAWYRAIIPEYREEIVSQLQNWGLDIMHRDYLYRDNEIIWNNLYDSGVCDCLRYTFPVCRNYESHSDRDDRSICPAWPGLAVGVTYETLFSRAYESNNPDNNYIKDDNTITGKGYPNYSWFEGLAYPGEYGHPYVCMPDDKLPARIRGFQPGLTDQDGNSVNLRWKDLSWYNKMRDPTDGRCHTGQTLVDIKSDGSFPEYPMSFREKNNVCIEPFSMPPPQALRNRASLFASNGGDSACDFPREPCKDASNQGFHGLWLYPLRGVGMWRNIGNTWASNSKFDFLLTYPKIDYTIDQLLSIASHGGGAYNLSTQVKKLEEIIDKGETGHSDKKKTISDLQKYRLYPGFDEDYSNLTKEDRKHMSRDMAKKLVVFWHSIGYTGIQEGIPNGFNYNPDKYMPFGMLFSYAASFDSLLLAVMAEFKLDTIQVLLEPQSSKSGLRPAYFFEVFQATPTSKVDPTRLRDSEFKNDLTKEQCAEFYMLNPYDDIDNYLKYGYMSDDKVKSKVGIDNLRLFGDFVSFH